jgi:hypothetical protein
MQASVKMVPPEPKARVGCLAPAVFASVALLWVALPSVGLLTMLLIVFWPAALVGLAILLFVVLSQKYTPGIAQALILFGVGLLPLPPVAWALFLWLENAAPSRVAIAAAILGVPVALALIARRKPLAALPLRARLATIIAAVAGPALVPFAAFATGLEFGYVGGGLLVFYPLCMGCLATTYTWLRGQPSATARVLRNVGKVLPPFGLAIALLVSLGHSIEDVDADRGDFGWWFLSPERGGLIVAIVIGALWRAMDPPSEKVLDLDKMPTRMNP